MSCNDNHRAIIRTGGGSDRIDTLATVKDCRKAPGLAPCTFTLAGTLSACSRFLDAGALDQFLPHWHLPRDAGAQLSRPFRASKSFDPPGAKWAMIVMLRSGHAARTGAMPINRIATATTAATDIHSCTRLNIDHFPPLGFQCSGSPEFDIRFSETFRSTWSKAHASKAVRIAGTLRESMACRYNDDVKRYRRSADRHLATSIRNPRVQGNVNGKATRRHHSY